MARRAMLRESDLEIMGVIDRAVRKNMEPRRELLLFSRRVHRYWRKIAPVGDPTGARYVENFGGPLPKHWQQTDPSSGSYRAGIVNRAGPRINGFPSRVIAATDSKSHWIEYGTGGSTPTPEFAPRQRTATRFAALKGVRGRVGDLNAPTRGPRKGRPTRRGLKGLEIGSQRPSGRLGAGSGYERI